MCGAAPRAAPWREARLLRPACGANENGSCWDAAAVQQAGTASAVRRERCTEGVAIGGPARPPHGICSNAQPACSSQSFICLRLAGGPGHLTFQPSPTATPALPTSAPLPNMQGRPAAPWAVPESGTLQHRPPANPKAALCRQPLTCGTCRPGRRSLEGLGGDAGALGAPRVGMHQG